MAVDIPVFPPLLLSKISVAMGFYSQGVSKIDPFLRHRLALTTHLFGLHCGMWVIDCASPKAYNVSVMAPFER